MKHENPTHPPRLHCRNRDEKEPVSDSDQAGEVEAFNALAGLLIALAELDSLLADQPCKLPHPYEQPGRKETEQSNTCQSQEMRIRRRKKPGTAARPRTKPATPKRKAKR